MTRIISGEVGGLRLRTPPGSTTRPTSERVREAVFSRLEHLDVLAGARVLDLYAGSGALGLEAASRGATDVVFVESHRAALDVLRANTEELAGAGLRARLDIRGDAVQRVLLAGGSGDVTLALLDPPYDITEDQLGDVLALLVAHEWLAPDAVVVVERSSRSPEPRWPSGLVPIGQRAYGETTVWFAEPPEPGDVA